MTKTIDWGDGTTDKITLTYNAASGNQNVSISSDANSDFVERSKDITFSALVGGKVVLTRTLTITQQGRNLIVVTDNGVATTDNDVVGGDEA